MSEEKLYAVKNDEGKYWDFYNSGFWKPDSIDCIATPIKKQAELVIKYYGGHVVTLVEEPEKVVLTKEQAKVIEETHGSYLPATRIVDNTRSDEEEELMMNAYVNGYTVAKEKRYNIKVPHTDKTLYRKHDSGALFASIYIGPQKHANDFLFTEAEIEYYGLQNCERVEVKE